MVCEEEKKKVTDTRTQREDSLVGAAWRCSRLWQMGALTALVVTTIGAVTNRKQKALIFSGIILRG